MGEQQLGERYPQLVRGDVKSQQEAAAVIRRIPTSDRAAAEVWYESLRKGKAPAQAKRKSVPDEGPNLDVVEATVDDPSKRLKVVVPPSGPAPVDAEPPAGRSVPTAPRVSPAALEGTVPSMVLTTPPDPRFSSPTFQSWERDGPIFVSCLNDPPIRGAVRWPRYPPAHASKGTTPVVREELLAEHGYHPLPVPSALHLPADTVESLRRGSVPSDSLEVCWSMAWGIQQAANEVLAALAVFWESPAGEPLRRAFQFLWFAFHVYQAAMHDFPRTRVAPHWRYVAIQEQTRRSDSYVPSSSSSSRPPAPAPDHSPRHPSSQKPGRPPLGRLPSRR